MRILIYGSTPIGAYLAAHFSFLKQDALWLANAATTQAIQRAGGIQAIGARGRRRATNIAITDSPDEAFSRDYAAIFMVMQSYDVAESLYTMQRFDKVMGAPPAIIAVQRGIGAYERVVSVFGAKNVIRAAPTYWIEHPIIDGNPAPETFVRLPNGGVALSANHPKSSEIAALLHAAYLPVSLGDAREIGWSALLWQLQTNAVAALVDVSGDDVLNSPALWTIEHRQLIEALGVIQSLRVRLVDLPGAPVPQFANQLQTLPPALLPALLVRSHFPASLRHELALGLPRSEAAYLNGAIALHANDLSPKLSVPINYALALTLDDIAGGRALWAQFRGDPRSLEAIARIAAYR